MVIIQLVLLLLIYFSNAFTSGCSRGVVDGRSISKIEVLYLVNIILLLVLAGLVVHLLQPEGEQAIHHTVRAIEVQRRVVPGEVKATAGEVRDSKVTDG